MNTNNIPRTISRKTIFPATLENLEAIAKFILMVCVEAGTDESTTYKVQLSVDEACSNIIEYGYLNSDEQPNTIECECKITETKIIIKLHDNGFPFNPINTPNPEISSILENRPSGGLGIYFIRQYMDEIRYEYISPTSGTDNSNKHGNYLTLVKSKENLKNG